MLDIKERDVQLLSADLSLAVRNHPYLPECVEGSISEMRTRDSSCPQPLLT
jgi:hypothetical protein